jgi:hypothetical protein
VARPHPLRIARDLFVYAPVGFLVEAPRLVPELIQTGRERLTGCRPAEGAAGSSGRRSSGTGRRGRTVGGAPPTVVAPVGVEQEIPVEVVTGDAASGGDAAGDDTLPIPSYDQLAASQVMARLAGLDAADLDRIEAYEQAHRARRTILARISQLRRV